MSETLSWLMKMFLIHSFFSEVPDCHIRYVNMLTNRISRLQSKCSGSFSFNTSSSDISPNLFSGRLGFLGLFPVLLPSYFKSFVSLASSQAPDFFVLQNKKIIIG